MTLLDGFEGLKIDKSLAVSFDDIELVKVTIKKDTNTVYIYIDSPKIIPFNKKTAMEEALYEQFFKSTADRVVIVDHYVLPGNFTLSKLISLYKDTLYDEIRFNNMMDYIILKQSDVRIDDEDNSVTLVLDDSFITKIREKEFTKWLKALFEEKFDRSIEVKFELEAYDEDDGKPVDDDYIVPYEEYVLPGVGTLSSDDEAISGNEPDSITDGTDINSPDNSKGSRTEGKKSEGKKSGSKKSDSKKSNKDYYRKKAERSDPDIIYGKNCDGELIEICEIQDELGEVVIHGCVDRYDMRELKSGNNLVVLNVTDYTDTICVKMFLKNEALDEIKSDIKEGAFLRIRGKAERDSYDNDIIINRVTGIKKEPAFSDRVYRADNSVEKRVELHCHTKMSDMDGVSSAKDLIARALKWGHKALAITDHGVVQAFPLALKAIKDLSGKYETAKDFKIIYGLEGYIVDDEIPLVRNSKGQSLSGSFVVFDIETTGLNPYVHDIIEIGAVKIDNGVVVDRFSEFVNPLVSLPYEIEKLTNINDSMLKDARLICEGSVLVAHNAVFDVNFIRLKAEEMGIKCSFTFADTMTMARVLLTDLKTFNLKSVTKATGVVLNDHHRAVNDAEATAEVFLRFLGMLKEEGVSDTDQLNEFGRMTPDVIRKTPAHHISILAANDTGRVNLYRLVSESHINYFNRSPKIPKSLLKQYREGLIIGSACEAGELYQSLLRGEDEEELKRLVEFYDYIEIMPAANNAFMTRGSKYGFKDLDDIKETYRKLVELGERYDRPVVATSDVHFLDPEDKIYRSIIMAGKGYEDADFQPPLYLHTTEEMLDEFSYLGTEKAFEVVVTNSNLIADRIEKISPVRPDKCPPVFENSDEDLRRICYEKAHSMYGEELPDIVKTRLDKELDSIISNGYSVMYIIAKDLVWKSLEDGYLVGSRGSVGSSFAATMAGITEVNPLPAHYYCKKCHFSDFDSDIVKEYIDMSGFDMPDRQCPVCGEKLSKDGHNIPFETFLGFKGDKEPDIDLNFSGEYQSKAHKYTEVLFGEGNTFRAGTIGTLAEKTAEVFVVKYYEERGVKKRRCEIERIAKGCTGVHRTTGQHPGGIVVLPHGEEIYSFTPIQKPANDMSTDIITTHFEYHAIDHNLLKLDILGHDDPTMIRMLQDITGVALEDIPLYDEKVMTLFSDTDALGIRPEDIGGCTLGSLGIPELGTKFSMDMLLDTSPTTFSELVRISGLSHGTDVWTNNAQDYIRNNVCTLSTAICTRDDIMTYLIEKGVESSLSFKIMESVRKGKGLTDEMETAMRGNDVTAWYIDSCKKIKYMFPKAHAVAYIMMGVRIAWFKVYHPLAYYAAFFSIRAKTFNYEIMAMGDQTLNNKINEINALSKPTAKEQDMLKDMKIVQEFYARGFKFEPIDIYKAEIDRFIITDEGKIMPSLASIEGLGGVAAESVYNEAGKGEFYSIDDFKERTGIGSKTVEKLKELKLFGNLSQSNQMSILDYLS